MDIAAMSTMISQAKVQQQASISVMKMAMNVGKSQMNDMVEMAQQNIRMMEQSVNPHIGGKLDIKL